ncbi:heparinase II/III family protein [Anaeromyxobacter diazotrophicus]|uniref:Heparin-sulfate lyase N-terminal domain-containing protein n=1 Tax=Anaeromyxobacter diazotrophicus TaxID=2590199 RepID=A0A7I9VIX0_9BACT|nr:alginate lyase family protein [Anaeromyxobacter diazotrophicus]GEJ56354.1 hypothetical protein AMYX_10950 [Anaeromyxobacter diazotrophicus]
MSPWPLPLNYLAARVPPGRLLAGATRRAWRSVRARAEPASPPARELLDGIGCASAAELSRRLGSPGRALVAYDRFGLAEALARRFPAERERAVARAEEALSGRWTIFGREVEVSRDGGGTDWNLDPLTRLRFPPSPVRGTLSPSVQGADPKAAWAVGRGEQWVALGCAGVAAPERAARYAEAFTASLRDFAAENPLGAGVQWASPMEAALRLVCAGQAHALLSGQPALADPPHALALAQLAVGTARLLLARREDAGAIPNNHLVADLVGLLAAAALLPEWPEAPRWRAAGAAGLRREILAQTHADGTSFEGSVPYHRLALELFTAGALLARRARARLGEAYARRLAAMYAAARALLFQGGALPQLGDHDSGRVLAFRARPALDAGYLLPLGAAVTGDAALRLRPGVEDAEEALWTCGPAALERLAAAPPGPPPRSASFPEGGFHLLRRGGAEVALSCGRNGQAGVGGHSHNDKLAFELRLGGELVVCDPGSPCYTADPALRDAFRATRAHATVALDGAEQAPIPRGRPFALPDAARAVRLAFASGAEGERFAGEHQGYARLGVVHRRELLLADGGLLVLDRLLGAGAHEVELRWPFPDEEARLRPLTAGERLGVWAIPGTRLQPFDLERAVEVGPAASPRAVLVVAGSGPLAARLAPAGYAPGYGELRPSRTAVFTGRLACPATLCTVVLSPGAGAP